MGKIRNAEKAQRIRKEIMRGRKDGATYDPFSNYSKPPQRSSKIYEHEAYMRSYRAAAERYIANLSRRAYKEEKYVYERKFHMNSQDRQIDDLMQEVKQLRGAVEDLETAVTSGKQNNS